MIAGYNALHVLGLGMFFLILGVLTIAHFITRTSTDYRKYAVITAWSYIKSGGCPVMENDCGLTGCRNCWIVHTGIAPVIFDRAVRLVKDCDDLDTALKRCVNNKIWIERVPHEED